MANDDDTKPPKSSAGDYGHAVVRAVLGAIPIGGAAATEIFNAVVMPPLDKRRDRWREMVGMKLKEQASVGAIDLEALASNESFATVAMHASQVAIRTHSEEKLAALRNALLNAALPNPPEESLQQMFIHLVDSFTEWHIRILKLFQDPPHWFQVIERQEPKFFTMSSISQVLIAAYPELQDRRQFYDLILSELEAKSLCSGVSAHVSMSGSGALDKRTTDLGDQFLRFISEQSIDGGNQ